MKTKLSLAAVSCLLFSLTSYAQPQSYVQMERALQQFQKNGMKAGLRFAWDGQVTSGLAIGLMQDPDYRTALNVSDEQFQEIQNVPDRVHVELQNNPEHKKLREEIDVLGGRDALYEQRVDKETQEKLLDIEAAQSSLWRTKMNDAISNILTSEQKQKVNETFLANLAEMPMATPIMFEALNLTDAQKQQMSAIKKELEPEFEQCLENFVNDMLTLQNKVLDELEKQGGLPAPMTIEWVDGEEGERIFAEKMKESAENAKVIQEKKLAIQKKLMQDPEYKKMSEGLFNNSKAFSMKFNTKMFDVLTDEQWKRLQDLIDNPPEYGKILRTKLRKERGEREKTEAWAPGPNSWKPGDPIPEQYRQERNKRKRFPGVEQ